MLKVVSGISKPVPKKFIFIFIISSGAGAAPKEDGSEALTPIMRQVMELCVNIHFCVGRSVPTSMMRLSGWVTASLLSS